MSSIKDFLYPKLLFDRDMLQSLALDDPEIRNEMAIPSYLHPNPLVRWIVYRRMNVVIDMLKLEIGERIVDYGCGTGILFLQIPCENFLCYGVDINLTPAEKFLKHHGCTNINLIHANEWESMIPDKSLDKIVALEVLEHVDDLSHVLLKFRQKLASQGSIVISGPTENHFYQLVRRIAGFSGDYHNRNIDIIRDVAISMDFYIEKYMEIPIRGPLCLFKIYRMSKSTKIYSPWNSLSTL